MKPELAKGYILMPHRYVQPRCINDVFLGIEYMGPLACLKHPLRCCRCAFHDPVLLQYLMKIFHIKSPLEPTPLSME
jgi:hypothetical protein